MPEWMLDAFTGITPAVRPALSVCCAWGGSGRSGARCNDECLALGTYTDRFSDG